MFQYNQDLRLSVNKEFLFSKFLILLDKLILLSLLCSIKIFFFLKYEIKPLSPSNKLKMKYNKRKVYIKIK